MNKFYKSVLRPLSRYFKSQPATEFLAGGGTSVVTDKQKASIGRKPEANPVPFEFEEFDHLQITSGNPKQAAFFYSSMFGFRVEQCEDIYQQSGSVCYYLRSGGVRLLIRGRVDGESDEVSDFLRRRGDGVSQVGMRVKRLAPVRAHLESRGLSVSPGGSDHLALLSMEMFQNMRHVFVERSASSLEDPALPFWPGLTRESSAIAALNSTNDFLSERGCGVPEFVKVDHVGFPQQVGQAEGVIESYFEQLGFYMFWSIDEAAISSEQSSLKSTVVSDYRNQIRFPIFEPVPKDKKSQIQEFLDYNDGPGAQHVAIEVTDILATVKAMRRRGVEFLPVTPAYYDIVHQKLTEFGIHIREDFDDIRANEILLDFDQKGNYMLQIFTKPLTDRPTLFLEFIQRSGHQGFGEGNFNRLFLSIEMEQQKRGNLV